jgi:hypothetical protein
VLFLVFVDADDDLLDSLADFFGGELLGEPQPRSETITGIPLTLSENVDRFQSSVAFITGDIAFFGDAGNGVPLILFLTTGGGGITTGRNISIGL